MVHMAGAVEAVTRKAVSPSHLVGHSFGGLAILAVALRGRLPLARSSITEPGYRHLPYHGYAPELGAFAQMPNDYARAFTDGRRDTMAGMVDFHGGAGSFASCGRSGYATIV